MERLLFLIVLFAILATLLVVSRRRAGAERLGTLVYERRPLFGKVERSFLRVLDEAAGDRVRVFGRVRLDDLVQVPSVVAEAERRAARGRFARAYVDFVLCDAADLRVLAVVELGGDDDDERTEEGDAVVEAALASAGIPVLRFAARSGYAVDEVRRRLEAVVPAIARPAARGGRKKHGKGAGGRRREPADPPGTVEVAESGPVQGAAPEVPAGDAAETAPTPAAVAATRAAATIAGRARGADGERSAYARLGTCPTCGRPMVERVGKRGALKGKPFLVCSGDPPCDPALANG